MNQERIAKRFEESSQILRLTGRQLADVIAQAAEVIVSCLRGGGGVFLFGNGGSAADAQHAAAELVGRYMKERRSIRAEALTTDTSILTAVANDYSFDRVFSRQLEGKARAGDVAVALTTSGNSPNIVEALRTARTMGLKTIALTGQGGGRCAELADVLLAVPCAGPSARIQEAHAVIYHTLCELVEEALSA